MTRVIDRFTGEHRFLSNFWLVPVELDGAEYPTVEHAYQAAKSADPAWRARVRAAARPGDAKRLGRAAPQLSSSFDRVAVMRALVRQKFARHAELRERLLATGDAELIEGNDWGDRFWGVSGGRGQNQLGRMLMEVRAGLREGALNG